MKKKEEVTITFYAAECGEFHEMCIRDREGTVQYVDDAGQLGISWDNGRSLSVIPGVDSFHKKEGQGHPEEKPRKKRESDLQR